MRVSDLKTRQKLGFGFGAMIVLSIIIGVFGFRGVKTVERESKNLDMVRLAHSSFIETRLYMRTFVHLQDTQYYGRAEKSIINSLKSLSDLQVNMSGEGKELVERLKQGLEGYHALMAQNLTIVIGQIKAVEDRNNKYSVLLEENEKNPGSNSKILTNLALCQNNVSNLQIYNKAEFYTAFMDNLQKIKTDPGVIRNASLITLVEEYGGTVVEFKNLTQQMKELETKQLESGKAVLLLSSQTAEKIEQSVAITTKGTITGIVLVVLIVILLGVTLSYIITVFFTSKISKAVKLAENFAAGNLLFVADQNDLDLQEELGALARSMDNMGNKLKKVLEEVNKGAKYVSEASQQLSSTTQQLSEGASEQASSVEEVSSSMEQMVSNIQQNTENSRQTAQISISAAKGAETIKQSSKESMDSIRTIAEKITIINDIAFQTNILALNAAVEAARAGEHGRGFAVVAAEVRKLAERCKISADEISKLSRDSVHLTDQSANILGEIIPKIERSAVLIQEITAASIEQNAGADQVNNAIQQLNQVTQQNAAVSEEIATTSEELASQAEQLAESVSYFKI